jgi:hypothetical protein
VAVRAHEYLARGPPDPSSPRSHLLALQPPSAGKPAAHAWTNMQMILVVRSSLSKFRSQSHG